MKTSAVMLTLAATAATSNALDFLTIGNKLATLNTGMMQSMQPDPTNTYSDCYLSSQITGDSIIAATDFSTYLTGGFNTADLMSKAQIIAMNLMTQYDDCKYTGFLVQLDQFMSNIPQFAGSISNLGTQFATGWTDSNTPVFISYNTVKDAYDNGDWNGMGQAV
jgi:hypothetical protein